MARLTITADTLRRLFAYSGNVCAMPDCTHRLINEKGKFIGQVCHIEAANKGGERYNPTQNDEERRHFDNLMLLCYAHHVETNEINEFPVEKLRAMKACHEEKFAAQPYQLPEAFVTGIFNDIQQALDKLITVSNDINEKASQILQILEAKLVKPAIDEEKIYIGQLESIRRLKKDLQHRSALKMLEEYRQHNWSRLSPENKYRVLANIGLTHLDLQEKEEACEAFSQIKDTGWETEDAVSLQLIGLSLLHDKPQFELYFKKAMGLNPENINAWVAFLLLNGDTCNVDELASQLPANLLEKQEILFNLGEIALRQSLKEAGIAYLKKAEAKLSGEPAFTADIRSAIASKILAEIITPFKFLYKQFSDSEISYLSEANSLFTESWDLIKGTEFASSRWHVVMNRGITFKLLNKPEPALLDLAAAYEISGNIIAFKNLAVTYIQLGRPLPALELCDKLHSKQDLPAVDRQEIDLIRAKALCGVGRVNEGITLLITLLPVSVRDFKLQVILTIINIYIDLNEPSGALTYSKMLKEEYPDDIHTHMAAGHLAWKMEDDAGALEAYNLAHSCVDDNTPPYIVYDLADSFLQLKEYDKASGLFKKVVDESIFNPAAKGLVYSCYQAGDISTALRLSEAYFKEHPADPLLAEIIIKIYQEINDYRKALEVAESFVLVAPKKYRDIFYLKLAELYFKQRDWQKLGEVCDAILQPLGFSPDDSFNLAAFLIRAGNVSKALAIAYEVRYKNIGDPRLHGRYMDIMHRADKKFPFEMFPEKVSTECAVVLKKHGNPEWTVLITADNMEGEHILKPTDTFSGLLLGKSKGARVVQEKKFGIKQAYTIVNIMHKYVFAAHETTKLFERKFAGAEGFEVLQSKPGEPGDPVEELVKNIAINRRQADEKLFGFYNGQIMTLGSMASMSRQNIVRYWLSMTRHPDVHIFNYTANEQAQIEKIVANGPLVVDITALLTAFYVYPENNFIEKLQARVIIAQSVVDELYEYYDEIAGFEEEGQVSLGYMEGHLASYVTESSDIKGSMVIIEKILNWCRNNATIESPRQNLLFSRSTREEFTRVLGHSSHDTTWLAKEHQSVVLSDDGNFKKFLTAEHRVWAFSTYQMSVRLLGLKKISLDEQRELSARLIQANYIFIPVSGNLLWKIFTDAGFKVQKPFTTAVKGLQIMLPLYAANTVVFFAKELSLNLNLPETKEQILLFVLSELSRHAEYAKIKTMIPSLTEIHFKVLQKQAMEFMGLFSNF